MGAPSVFVKEANMLILNFHPESDLVDVTAASAAYSSIWEKDGARIVAALEKYSGLKFEETFINILVCDRFVSQSHPLLLGAKLDEAGQKCTLIHELAHRIAFKKRNLDHVADKTDSYETHAHLNLFLYDAWKEVYGEEFANASVEMEKKITAKDDKVYRPAWEKVMQMSFEERQAEVKKIFSKNADNVPRK